MNRFSNVMRIILKPTQPDAARKIQIFKTKTAPPTLTANAAFLKHPDFSTTGSRKGDSRAAPDPAQPFP